MSTATTEDEIRDYLTTGVDGKPGIPAGLAEPIVEYLANMGLSLEDVKGLSIEDFSLAYQAVHDKAPSVFESNYIKKFYGVGVSAAPDVPVQL